MDICVAVAFTIGNPLGCRGSACVKVMTILHGSPPSLQRRAKGCLPPEGMIVSARDTLKSTIPLLEPPWPCRIGYQSEYFRSFHYILSSISTIVGVLVHLIWVQLLGLELEDGWVAGPSGSS
ncbi:hypothetical protein AAG906_021133 [Vitis piasezkii]